MKIKNLIAILLVVTIMFCFAGCFKDKVEDETKPIETNPIETTDPIEETTDGTEPVFINADIIEDEKPVWEKEKQVVEPDAVQIGADWAKGIDIGGFVVSANEFTDMSAMPNYYYDEEDSYSALETAYNIPTYRIATRSGKTELSEFASVEMIVDGTTINTEDGYRVIVEGIRYLAYTNPHEGGLEVLKENAKDIPEGQFGLGSTYAYINELLGEPLDFIVEIYGDGDVKTNTATAMYISDETNTEIILGYTWTDNEEMEEAVLTSIDWTPLNIRLALHTQSNMDEFDGY